MWSTLNTEVTRLKLVWSTLNTEVSRLKLGVKYSEHRANGVERGVDTELP